MNLAHAVRAALVTVALAGAAVLGTQVAQADGPAVPATPAGTSVPAAATPSPTATHETNPWD
ncbi:hypothetical protein [Streptomyces sp. cmx-4-9]|uniref:hypothetical protein n=1 Tax=Streptomyces sp. cmx-4-9 TaxID=2790941 RepID=UPI00397EDCAA